jgi:hypothetical protein
MPDLIRRLDPASSPHLDSGLVVIPDPDPGRNDDIEVFSCRSNKVVIGGVKRAVDFRVMKSYIYC